MKKLVATLIVLSFAGNAIAATTYTEQIVNKWTAPVAQKERQLQAQREAAQKAQKQREEAQKKRQEEIKKAQEKSLQVNELGMLLRVFGSDWELMGAETPI